MKRKLKVLAVCGFGVGTSLILRMNIESVLKANGIIAEVTNADLMTATSIETDIIFTSEELYNQIRKSAKVPIVVITNFMSKKEIEEKGILEITKLNI
jgi:PTS system ascorbate-specific IIB component